MKDIILKQCDHQNCGLGASHTKLFSEQHAHCRDHSTLNEYSRKKSLPACTVINCWKNAYFIDNTDINVYPIRCYSHRFYDDIELVYKQCPRCKDKLYFPINRELCMNCGLYRGKTLYRFKETMVKYMLQSNGIAAVYDKAIVEYGSEKRPDFLIQTNFGYIILEVDEHQHKKYNIASESNRMQILYFDIKLLNPYAQVLFIRYNPNHYISQSDVVAPIQNVYRLTYLHNLLQYLIPLTTIGCEQGKIMLYYDGFNNNPIIEPIIYFDPISPFK